MFVWPKRVRDARYARDARDVGDARDISGLVMLEI